MPRDQGTASHNSQQDDASAVRALNALLGLPKKG